MFPSNPFLAGRVDSKRDSLNCCVVVGSIVSCKPSNLSADAIVIDSFNQDSSNVAPTVIAVDDGECKLLCLQLPLMRFPSWGVNIMRGDGEKRYPRFRGP